MFIIKYFILFSCFKMPCTTVQLDSGDFRVESRFFPKKPNEYTTEIVCIEKVIWRHCMDKDDAGSGLCNVLPHWSIF